MSCSLARVLLRCPSTVRADRTSRPAIARLVTPGDELRYLPFAPGQRAGGFDGLFELTNEAVGTVSAPGMSKPHTSVAACLLRSRAEAGLPGWAALEAPGIDAGDRQGP